MISLHNCPPLSHVLLLKLLWGPHKTSQSGVSYSGPHASSLSFLICHVSSCFGPTFSFFIFHYCYTCYRSFVELEVIEQVEFMAWTWMKCKIQSLMYPFTLWSSNHAACLSLWGNLIVGCWRPNATWYGSCTFSLILHVLRVLWVRL